MQKVFIVLFMIAILLSTQGCSLYQAPDSFTPKQKVEYTTLKTLKTAKQFRVFALSLTGDLYKNGLLTEKQKEEIITLGDSLQGSINTAANALILYHKGLIQEENVSEKIEDYTNLFNDFLKLITPYL